MSSSGLILWFERRFWIAVLFSVVLVYIESTARADKVTLADGRVIEGKLGRLSSLLIDLKNTAGGDKPVPRLIVMADNEMTMTYIPWRYVRAVDPVPAGQRMEQIDVPQPVENIGARVGSVGPPIDVTSFDQFGRRTYSMLTAKGRVDVVQGITRITPIWCRIQGLQLQTLPSYVWDLRMATSSIPRDSLSEILGRLINPKDADDRLKVVRLYIQAERFKDAEKELEQVIQDFPDRKSLVEVARDIKQQEAQQLVQEIDVRRGAGQHQLAISMLEKFPADGVGGQILQQVRAKLDDYNILRDQGRGIVKNLDDMCAGLSDATLKARVAPLVKEIKEELKIGTLDRMATYQRFADGPQNTPEQLLSLAISGWLVGADEATENLQITLSLAEMRDLVRAYLGEEQRLARDQLFEKIKAQEAMSVKLLAAIIANMKPPKQVKAQDTPGYYELSVPGPPGEGDYTYAVQLPPEYDPHGSYPCVVTLNGLVSTPQQQIDWWAGAAIKDGNNYFRGQATRYGYIVVAPTWLKPHQKQYEGTAREHACVLATLRDACRCFAIDTDRVYLSGHSLGGNAAWDIGLSHPDLWAGVIPIVAQAQGKVTQYRKNADKLAMYFVAGELDGDKLQRNSGEFEAYMNSQYAVDCTLVEYLGRGHEHYSDEILHLFDWMGRKKRDFFPKDFSVYTQRPWDNFFWWVELPGFVPGNSATPVEAKVTGNNGLTVKTGGKLTVWLSPEVVDFNRPISVTQGSRNLAPRGGVRPDPLVLLEDARTRADRKHPFWAKVE